MTSNDPRASKESFATRAETIGTLANSKPQTGNEYLESLRDERELYIYGERVNDVTSQLVFYSGHYAALVRRPGPAVSVAEFW